MEREKVSNGDRGSDNTSCLFRLNPHFVTASLQGPESRRTFTEPLLAAVVNEQLFICGTSVSQWRAANKGGILPGILNLGRLLLAEGESDWVTLDFEDRDFYVPFEFLLGAFFLHLRRKLKTSSLKVLITIPLWFGSIHRKRVKDAGVIAGFEVTLMNETAAIAYTLIKTEGGASEAKSCCRRVVIVSESCGHVDVAYYRYIYASKELKMLTSAGSAFPSNKTVPEGVTQDRIKRRYYESMKKDDKTVTHSRRQLLTSLIAEVIHSLPVTSQLLSPCFDPRNECVSVAALCEDESWLEILESIQDLDLEQDYCIHDLEGRFALRKLHLHLHWLTKIDFEEETNLKDLMPYRLSRSTAALCGELDEMILEKNEDLPEGRMVVAELPYAGWSVTMTFRQRSSIGLDFVVGTLEFQRVIHAKFPRKVEVTFWASEEGIFQFLRARGFTSDEDEGKRLRSEVDYFWKPADLAKGIRVKTASRLPGFMEYNLGNLRKFRVMNDALINTCWRMKQLLKERRGGDSMEEVEEVEGKIDKILKSGGFTKEYELVQKLGPTINLINSYRDKYFQ